MKYFFIFLAFTAISMTTKAQSDDELVITAVNNLFAAMINSDSVALKNAFTENAVLQTIVTNKEGKTVVKNESIADFASSIGKLEKGAADERILFDMIKIDGALATVWTPYKFYYKGDFSHCGVNSFQLVKINGAFKIQYIIDTRRKIGCD